MEKNTANMDINVTPDIRFPGFSEKWEIKTLGELATKVNRKNRQLQVSRVLTNSATEGIIDQNDYFDRDIAVKENTENYHIVEAGDFVYNPRISVSAPVGPISVNKVGTGIMSPLYTVFRIQDGYIPFYEQYFQTKIWHSYLKSIANFGARFDRMNITTEGFFNMPIFVPSFAEQKKIAEFLEVEDKMIAAQKQKVESLKAHKKGLMQQIFPQSGEDTPRLRFPGFEGEWEERTLGEIGDTFSGLTGKSKEDFENGNSKFITFMNVLKNVRIDTSILGTVNVGDRERQNKVENGDMLFNTSSETPEEVGFCAVYDSDIQENVYLNSFCFGYRFKDKTNYYPLFLAYYLRSVYGRNLMNRLAQGITRFNLSKEYFNKAIIPFPTFNEQQKIAECLSSLDQIISAGEKELEAIKVHKKGLMQQLFPQFEK